MTVLEEVLQRAESDARTHGYHLNPDSNFLKDLLEGLRRNEERHGYPSCPCRFSSGRLEFDRDIICPCDYRDPDVEEFGHCYCALYVRKDVFEGRTPIASIPERRPAEKQDRAYSLANEASSKPSDEPGQVATEAVKGASEINAGVHKVKLDLWYCKQCGYVCFREDPPLVCPICKAKKEMFGRIALNTQAVG